MTDTISISEAKYKSLSNRLDKLEQMMRLLAGKLEAVLEFEPRYGSEQWWEWSDKKSMEDYKAGKFTTLKNKKDIEKFFSQI